MAVKASDLSREQLEKLVGDIVETLYPAANPSRQWSADTIEWVSESLAEFDLIPECDGEFEDEDERFEDEDESDRWPCGELKDGGPGDPHGCPIHGADCPDEDDEPPAHDAAFDARLFSVVKAAHDAAEAARNDTGE